MEKKGFFEKYREILVYLVVGVIQIFILKLVL